MEIKKQIEQDYVSAMKNREDFNLSVFRMLKAAIKNLEIDKRSELEESEVIKLLKTEKKKRQEAADLYLQGSRSDLAEKEKKEMELIDKYLPKELSDEEINKAITEVCSSLGENKNFGLVMKETMKKLGSQADGQKVSKLVKEILG